MFEIICRECTAQDTNPSSSNVLKWSRSYSNMMFTLGNFRLRYVDKHIGSDISGSVRESEC